MRKPPAVSTVGGLRMCACVVGSGISGISSKSVSACGKTVGGMGEKWPKIDHIPPHFYFGAHIPPHFSGSRCSFPTVFRLPAPFSARRCFGAPGIEFFLGLYDKKCASLLCALCFLSSEGVATRICRGGEVLHATSFCQTFPQVRWTVVGNLNYSQREQAENKSSCDGFICVDRGPMKYLEDQGSKLNLHPLSCESA